MKKIKKLSLILLICVFTFVALLQTNVKPTYAYDSIDNTGTATWTVSNEETSDKYGLHYSHAIGTTMNNGAKSVDLNANFFSMKTDGENSKLVTWAIQSGNDAFVTQQLSVIAKDYEQKHPGWIVVAGINADQWYYGTDMYNQTGGYFYYKNQTYYPFTVDGQNLFTISPLNTRGNGVAIMNDSANPIIDIYDSQGIELQIYDANDRLIATYPVSGYNQTPGAGATTVWSGCMSAKELGTFTPREVTTSNMLYIIENAELAFMNNSRDYAEGNTEYGPTDSFYGRGVISTTGTTTTLTRGQFAIETTDEEVKQKLAEGVKVIVEQQYLPSDANKAESVTGYHTVHVRNGEYNNAGSGDYNNSDRPRSIFGVLEDGSYFLFTVRKNKASGGTAYAETNAILSYYNAYTAFQDDGGGSVMSIYRKDDGTFENVSPSTDGRGVFSGLFFVVRDPGLNSKYAESTPTTIT
ncbi:MAG: phosphodiester glycosidase family protein, partial [Prevotella sp.]|nr:phosphodiester glycosidase family protein [Staphylococcus sp.]MCM1350853.1 phosphodiester glycosidase family protein [Prevotella sp.]